MRPAQIRRPSTTAAELLIPGGLHNVNRQLGSGVCSRRKLWKLGRCPEGYVPSAYQIRYAGCKGMVSLDPSLCGNRHACLALSLPCACTSA